jgi:uncharacterized protein YbgA (DUF1722 family)
MKKINKMSDQEILDYLKLNRNNMVFPAFSREEFENLCGVIVSDENWEELCEFADGYLDCGTAFNCILNDFEGYCRYLPKNQD